MLADEIKRIVDDAGLTLYELERDADVSRAMLSRYFNGKVAMSIKTLDKLLEYLGYELTLKKRGE